MTPSPVDTARRLRSNLRWAGVRLSTFRRQEFVDVIVTAVDERSPLLVTFLNPFYARATDQDAELARIVDEYDIVQPDGWGVVYGARLAGVRTRERVAIEDVERPLFDALARRRTRLYLFGSEPGIPEAAARMLTTQFPGLEIAGTQHGWLDVERGHPGRLDDDDARTVAAEIAASRADLVMVGLPTPMQQQWTREFGAATGAPVVMTVGAYFDKLAEGLDWYPRWMERLRLGWIYRVYREPRRLLSRYTLGSVTFGRLVARHAVAARRSSR
jgi:N-acetylglucosaminyldiphosphoundecaprenol N-acetyl-beta-D-mannosaminyltransferase